MAIGLAGFAPANLCPIPYLSTSAIVSPAVPHLNSALTLATTNTRAVQGTAYVAAVKGLPNNFPNAYQWGVPYVQGCVCRVPYLQQNDFTKVPAPTLGVVIVFQPATGHGVDTVYGHVGVVQSVQPVTSKTGAVTGWLVTVREANQGGKTFTDAGCSNVSDIVFNISRTETLISCWTK